MILAKCGCNKRSRRWLGLLCLGALSCSVARAQTAERFTVAGVNLRAHYISESAYNPRGGRFEAARYSQQIDLGADLDLALLAGIPDARVKITLADRRGRSLSADALGNNRFAVQEVFGGGQGTRLMELHYQQALLDGRLFFDVGWAPLGGTFATSPVYCGRFQSLATCGTLELNNFNWQNWPFSQWGAMVRLQPSHEYYVSTGVYQVNPRHATDRLDLTFDSSGVIVPFEVGWLPGQGDGGLVGEYKLGGYYDSSSTPDVLLDINGLSAGLTGAAFARHNGRWGAYALATQMVYRESAQAKRGLTLFGMATLSDPQTESFRFFYVGAYYQGPFAHRDADFISLVYARGKYNGRLARYERDRGSLSAEAVAAQTHESVVELDYSFAVTPWLQLRPNLQYLMRPGGTGSVADALVVGLFAYVTF